MRRIFWFGFIQSIDKSKNQTKLAKLPGTNFVFIFSNIYVFYIYLFIALGIFCNINLSSFQKIFMLGWLLTKSHILFILQLIWNQFSKSHVTVQASCKWLQKSFYIFSYIWNEEIYVSVDNIKRLKRYPIFYFIFCLFCLQSFVSYWILHSK